MTTEKYLQALRALNSAKAIDAASPELHVRVTDFKSRCESDFLSALPFPPANVSLQQLIVSTLPNPLREETNDAVSSGLESLAPGNPSLDVLNSTYLQQGPTTAPKLLAAARVALTAKHTTTEVEDFVFQMLNAGAQPTVSVRSTSQTVLWLQATFTGCVSLIVRLVCFTDRSALKHCLFSVTDFSHHLRERMSSVQAVPRRSLYPPFSKLNRSWLRSGHHTYLVSERTIRRMLGRWRSWQRDVDQTSDSSKGS